MSNFLWQNFRTFCHALLSLFTVIDFGGQKKKNGVSRAAKNCREFHFVIEKIVLGLIILVLKIFEICEVAGSGSSFRISRIADKNCGGSGFL